jgi:hypothetical protein
VETVDAELLRFQRAVLGELDGLVLDAFDPAALFAARLHRERIAAQGGPKESVCLEKVRQCFL